MGAKPLLAVRGESLRNFGGGSRTSGRIFWSYPLLPLVGKKSGVTCSVALSHCELSLHVGVLNMVWLARLAILAKIRGGATR